MSLENLVYFILIHILTWRAIEMIYSQYFALIGLETYSLTKFTVKDVRN